MKRTSLRRSARLRAMSTKRARQLPARRKAVRAALERAGYRCEAGSLLASIGIRHECDGALEPHEPLTRARGGSITDPAAILIICSGAHRYAHAYPAAAKQCGLLHPSWGEP